MKNEENHQNERPNYESNTFWLRLKWPGETVLALWETTGTGFQLLSRKGIFMSTNMFWLKHEQNDCSGNTLDSVQLCWLQIILFM